MRKLSIAMLGFGNAGKAFARLLLEKHDEIYKKYHIDVEVVAIVTRSRGSLINEKGIDLSEALSQIQEFGRFAPSLEGYSHILSAEAAEKLNYHVLMELTPLEIFSGQPAISHIKTALCRGKHVITANKGPIAWAYNELKKMAQENNAHLLFETTVMDGTPIFNLIEKTLPLSKVIEIKGILNSTTNYILEEMAEGKAYPDILAEGRRRGFVESDPSLDTEGWDSAAKTAVLLNVLMDANITPMEVIKEGIENITKEQIAQAQSHGKVIKLICSGNFVDGKVIGRVAPTEISKEDFFAGINGTSSVVSITTDLMKTISIVEHDPEIEQTAYGPFSDLLRLIENLS
jgi:homoserine dehydrogenase